MKESKRKREKKYIRDREKAFNRLEEIEELSLKSIRKIVNKILKDRKS